jgi:hypothetical protein
LLIFLHHVRPGRQKEYEALMTEIWGSALREAAATGEGDWRWALTATRDLVPLATAPPDSSSTYAYLIDPAPPGFLSDTTGSFPQDLLVDAGYAPAEAESLAKRLDATIQSYDSYARLQRAFSRGQTKSVR